MKKIVLKEWQRLHRQGYAKIWDGQRYILCLDESGVTVWSPVEVIYNISRPHIDEMGRQTR